MSPNRPGLAGDGKVDRQVLVALGSTTDNIPLQSELDLVQNQVFEGGGQLMVHMEATHAALMTCAPVDSLHVICLVERVGDSAGQVLLSRVRSAKEVAEVVKQLDSKLVFLAGEGSDLLATRVHQELATLGVHTCAVVGTPDSREDEDSARTDFTGLFYKHLLFNDAKNPQRDVRTAYSLAEDELDYRD